MQTPGHPAGLSPSPSAATLTTVAMRSLPTWDTGAETNDIWWQRFWCVEVRPVVLLEQFERELELVEEGQALDRIGNRRLMLHHIVHVPQPSPGSSWR